MHMADLYEYIPRRDMRLDPRPASRFSPPQSALTTSQRRRKSLASKEAYLRLVSNVALISTLALVVLIFIACKKLVFLRADGYAEDGMHSAGLDRMLSEGQKAAAGRDWFVDLDGPALTEKIDCDGLGATDSEPEAVPITHGQKNPDEKPGRLLSDPRKSPLEGDIARSGETEEGNTGQVLQMTGVNPDFTPNDPEFVGDSGTGPRKHGESKRMMLVTGIDGRSCTTPRGAEILTKSLKNKMDYARLHGIPLWYSMEVFEDAYDIYWLKFPLLKKLMGAHPDVDWFMWVDCDAIFTDMMLEIPLDKYEGYNLVLSGNYKDVFEEPHWLGLNTGGFLMRNCQWSIDLMDAAMVIGNKYTLRDSSTAMLNELIRGRAEAGPTWPADDQTTIIYLFATQPHLWRNQTYLTDEIHYHHWWVETSKHLDQMQLGNGVNGPGSKWPFISHFTGCKFCHMQYGDEGKYEECLENFDKIYHFANNQVLENFGLRHKGLENTEVTPV